MNEGVWLVFGKTKTSATLKAQEAFTQKLAGISPAYENFIAMPPSVRLTYTRRYHSFKNEEARERDFSKIEDRLHQNL